MPIPAKIDFWSSDINIFIQQKKSWHQRSLIRTLFCTSMLLIITILLPSLSNLRIVQQRLQRGCTAGKRCSLRLGNIKDWGCLWLEGLALIRMCPFEVVDTKTRRMTVKHLRCIMEEVAGSVKGVQCTRTKNLAAVQTCYVRIQSWVA